MRLNAVTLTMLSVVRLVDVGEPLTVAQLVDCINDRSLFEVLERCLIADRMLAGIPCDLSSGERTEILDALGALINATTCEDLGVEDREHGLLFLSALFVQLIQSSNVSEIDLH